MTRILFGAAAAAAIATLATAQDGPAFGSEDDKAYATTLWSALEDARLAGEGAVMAAPYPGTDPHGMMLETFYAEATVDGHAGTLVVKRNYGPEGVTADEVLGQPEEHLAAVTVMFQRAEGYAPDSGDWFWAKYLPDGTLDQTPEGMAQAGLVGGCISCHAGAEGDDYLFTTNAAPGLR